MSTTFNNRVFGCVIVKSVNSNYNADFTHQPRTLPDGTVYATDKVLKYSVRNWIKKNHGAEKVFFFKSLNDDMQPLALRETYNAHFGELPKKEKDKTKETVARKSVLKNLFTCIDIRLFGGTFAEEGYNFSIHGSTQITHGVNRFPENAVYSEQISSPFRNANEKSTDSMQTTLGTQYKLREGHYVHHFSVNPGNISDLASLSEGQALQQSDIETLKAGLSRGVTFYDSSAKAGTENELLLWVQLKPDSKLVLPSFVELVSIGDDDQRTIDLTKVSEVLARPHVKAAIEKIEIWYDKTAATLKGAPDGAEYHEIHQ